eukprot:g13523.t1
MHDHPWFTDAKEFDLGSPTILAAASLGCNRVLLVSKDYWSDLERCEWRILTLTEECNHSDAAHPVHLETVPGPTLPDGLLDMTLCRIQDVVVAYGWMRLVEGDYIPVWFMTVYSISTGEWETIPYAEGECPVPRLTPQVCALSDRLVVIGGCGPVSEDREECPTLYFDTWEWSVYSREWTHRGADCPRQLIGGAAGVIGDVIHALADAGGETVQYSNGRYRLETDTWRSWLGVEAGFCLLDVPLHGQHRLIITNILHDDPVIAAQSLKYWIVDAVSLDRVQCQPLFEREEEGAVSYLDYGISDGRAISVMLNPTTLLVVVNEGVVRVALDPFLVSPEFHTSMVGTR